MTIDAAGIGALAQGTSSLDSKASRSQPQNAPPKTATSSTGLENKRGELVCPPRAINQERSLLPTASRPCGVERRLAGLRDLVLVGFQTGANFALAVLLVGAELGDVIDACRRDGPLPGSLRQGASGQAQRQCSGGECCESETARHL